MTSLTIHLEKEIVPSHLSHGSFLSICCCTDGLPLSILCVLLAGAIVDSTSIILSTTSPCNSLIVLSCKLYNHVANPRCQHTLPFGFLASLRDDHLHTNQCSLSITLRHYNWPVLLLMENRHTTSTMSTMVQRLPAVCENEPNFLKMIH